MLKLSFVILVESDKSEALCALACGKSQRISACSFRNFPSLAAVGQKVPYAFLFPAPLCQTLRLFCAAASFFFFLPSSPQQLQSKVSLVHEGFSLMLLS